MRTATIENYTNYLTKENTTYRNHGNHCNTYKNDAIHYITLDKMVTQNVNKPKLTQEHTQNRYKFFCLIFTK